MEKTDQVGLAGCQVNSFRVSGVTELVSSKLMPERLTD